MGVSLIASAKKKLKNKIFSWYLYPLQLLPYFSPFYLFLFLFLPPLKHNSLNKSFIFVFPVYYTLSSTDPNHFLTPYVSLKWSLSTLLQHIVLCVLITQGYLACGGCNLACVLLTKPCPWVHMHQREVVFFFLIWINAQCSCCDLLIGVTSDCLPC